MPLSTSIVIPTHNRPAALAETLGHLRGQPSGSRLDLDIVVIDDGSDPAVSGGPDYRVVRTPGIERARARNLGAISAKGELLIFIDDDISVGPDFLNAHQRGASEFGDVIGVGSISLPSALKGSPFGRFRQLIESPSQARPRGLVDEKNFCTAANMSIRRSTFLGIGGFDPEIVSSEDQDLAIRFTDQGGRIAFLPEASSVHMDSNADIHSYCQRSEWGARAMVPFLRRYADRPDSRERLRFEAGLVASSFRNSAAFLSRRFLSQPTVLRVLFNTVRLLERVSAGDQLLFPLYRVLLGLHLFRGFRSGSSQVKAAPHLPSPIVA